MLSRDELDGLRRANVKRERDGDWHMFDEGEAEGDIAALLAHIDALEAFRERVLAVARRLQVTGSNTRWSDGKTTWALSSPVMWEACEFLLALTEEEAED